MTSNEHWPQHNPPGGQRYGQQPPWPGQPLSRQANPTWMGQVPPDQYRAAPANTFAPAAHMVMPPAFAGNRTSTGVMGLVGAGGFLAFASLFLVVPFLLGNTGTGGFTVGFIASRVPLCAYPGGPRDPPVGTGTEAAAVLRLYLGCRGINRRHTPGPAVFCAHLLQFSA